MSKYGDDIRRISRYDQLLKLIRQIKDTVDQSEKSNIAGTRAIAYLDNKSLQTSANKGAIGVLTPTDSFSKLSSASGIIAATISGIGSAANVGAQQALTESNPLNGMGLSGTSSGISSFNNMGKEGWFNASSILDGAIDAFGKSPPIPGLIDDTAQVAGQVISTLNGLQLDDESQNILVHLKDAAVSFVAPYTWDTPFEQPTDDTFQYGYYWSYAGYNKATPVLALKAGIAAGVFPNSVYDEGTVTGTSGGYPNQYTYTVDPNDGLNPPFSVNVIRGGSGSDCSGTFGSEVCPASAPLVPSWFSMGVSQVAWVSPLLGVSPYAIEYFGRFMKNPYDINTPSTYSLGSSILDLKADDGSPIRIGPLKAGGWYMYYRDTGNNNLPIGNVNENSVVLIGADRNLKTFITPNELTKLLP